MEKIAQTNSIWLPVVGSPAWVPASGPMRRGAGEIDGFQDLSAQAQRYSGDRRMDGTK